ncbi:hypothetical protein EG68_05071 [Paragonimus skrjabini miyazakii]|uniref:Glycosyl transferase family 1 domain-containing protein n=1 Tax=Paragonimus skrjabini miyazakii TaxID=59628 RepID=A0A8S9YEY6_9TREM|nr:hypothetical protein EG68_05071 [Paragonimus skrjabini miyazakii]
MIRILETSLPLSCFRKKSFLLIHFRNLGQCTIISLDQRDIPELIDRVNSSETKKIAVIVHLRRCAEVLSKLDATIPVLAVCGGTDLNEDVHNVEYLKLMTKSVHRSRAVIVFTRSMLTRFQEFWDLLSLQPYFTCDWVFCVGPIPIFSKPSAQRGKIVGGLFLDLRKTGTKVVDVHTNGLQTGTIFTYFTQVSAKSVNVNLELAYRDLETHVDWLTKRLGCELTRYFLIVGRLRPVKDPQFALQPFIEWNSKPVTVLNQKTDEQLSRPYHHHLVYIGSVEEDTNQIRAFLASMKNSPHIHHIQSIDQDRLHSLMVASDGLINCSLSEGQSLTIMEAMLLGVPVIARRNSGNCDLIENDTTGLLFTTPMELKTCLTRLICEQGLRKKLTTGARYWIRQPQYRRNYQIKEYDDIFSTLLKP